LKLTKFSTLPGDSPEHALSIWAKGGPIYTQYKYHGISARYIPGQGLFTRQDKQWDLRRFSNSFRESLGQIENYTIYGELVIPNLPFPEAAGILNVNSNLPIPSVNFHLFDLEHLSKPATEQSFSWRLAQIQTLPPLPNILPALTYVHLEPIYADMRYHKAIELGFEGVVYRRDPCLLLYGDRPNPSIVKRKKLHSAEGVCFDYTEGQGKRKGMLGSLHLRLPSGAIVCVGGGAGLTEEYLIHLFKNPPINQTITFTYEEMSDTGVPLRGQFVSIRHHL